MSRAFALAAISAAVLAYEVLLTRLFAIVQWYHFAFMAISIALLGFGVSGAVLAVWRRAVLPRLDAVFALAAAGFALTAPPAFLLAQRVPFNALEVVWRPAQLLSLGAIYLMLTVPFAAGAACIGIAFLRADAPPGRTYFWNLLGSAAGALGLLGALAMLPPAGTLAAVSVLALGAAIAAALPCGRRLTSLLIALALLCAGAWALAPAGWTALQVAEHKGLALVLNLAGARLAQERFGPRGLVSVVESPEVPLRSAPGLSLRAPAPPPSQVAIFTDADAMTTIDRDAGLRSPDYLRHTTGALVYSLVRAPDVLVLGAGGGRGVAQALAHGANRVDAVEPNPDILDLVRGDYARFSGGLYERPEVTTWAADPRGFLAVAARRWDVIVVSTPAAGAGGAIGLRESGLLTTEAVSAMLQRLRPGGWISFSQRLELPPRRAPKLALTALEALERQGADAPEDHLILIRGMATTTLLVGRDPVTGPAVRATAAFAEARAFDLAYHPGLAPAAANRFNVLAEPQFFDVMASLTGPDRADFAARYKFDIRPARDDRPYFHDVFRWDSLPELLRLGAAGGAALLELGELILVGTLIQAILIGALLILLPLRLGGLAQRRGRLAWCSGGYFAAIGLAFLLVEIAVVHKLMLFLGHPTIAVAVALCGFLVFAGLGALASTYSARLNARRSTAAIELAIAGLTVFALTLLLIAPPTFAALAGLPVAGRGLVALALIAPLAFFMGMPFPLGLAIIAQVRPALVPWAWGVNGCASVVSAVLAILLALHLGYSAVVLVGLCLYALAALVIRGVRPASGS